MRKIIFRGKTEHDKKWLEGDLLQWSDGDMSILVTVGTEKHQFRVHSETVGQFSGFTDKNGVKIFEGDFVKHGDVIAQCVFNNTSCVLKKSNNKVTTWAYISEFEVIGNIHDNPEIFKIY